MNASPSLYPSFNRLITEGATTFNARTDFGFTVTLPNHTSMLTGRPVLQPSGAPNTTHHGYTDNETPESSDTLHHCGNPNLAYVASTFDVAHDNGLSTALYANKSKFSIFDKSYTDSTGAVDATGPNNGRDKIDTYVQISNGSLLHARFLSDVAAANELSNYTFLHYRDPDSAGHSAGWGSSQWNAAVQNVDGFIGDLIDLIESNDHFRDTVLIVTADHGGSETGHGKASNPSHYTIPVFVWGAGVASGEDLYALNPTTRLDPGAGRPDYTAAIQPIRNGDTGNLALDLLGLGAVPGSSINSSQNLQTAPKPDDELRRPADR